MQKMTFSLSISPELYERYYRGSAKAVIVTTDDGRKLQFPAGNLQKYITHDGIHGRFEITFDQNNKIIDFRRIQ